MTSQQGQQTTEQTPTGAESVHWDLADLYRDIDDPALEEDLQRLIGMAANFHRNHAGKLVETLGTALEANAEMTCLADKLMVYLFLRRSTDATNEKIQQRLGQVQEAWSRAAADHLNFFEHEVVAIGDDDYAAILDRDDIVARHRPLLDHMRANREYLLDENIERALTLRDPFGPNEWSDYVDEMEAELRFDFGGKPLTLSEILHVVSNDRDAGQRSVALEVFSRGLSEQRFERLMARTLNVVMGAKAVEDRERGYANPMTARNIGNRIDDETVDALHAAVADLGAAQGQRYYRLLAAHLGKSLPLEWSDRNAPLPYTSEEIVPWNDCVNTVLSAYESFSPTLRGLVAEMLDRNWIDAPPYEGKSGGAFNYSVLLPDGEPRAYNLLNYLGSPRDIMTVAHEVGHGAHGMLAAKAQGALMFRAPMAYAETASIFGEMTTFRYLLERTDNDEAKLALLMEKSADHINTVVRQISFSNFERKVHDMRRDGRLTVDEFDATWLEVTHAFYGKPGDLFTYEHVDNLWCYVSHFLRPFYVYAYAFGELFTQSLFARREEFGADFESMYLDLLRAGGSRDAVELMAPFGLDPRDPTFWRRGIEASICTWLDQAEAISRDMGVTA
ncbi:MAG: M3 family metallopeptidase [Gammaproteobacteria bacterium]|nr:M3 family metallopeptidase [Gammaproteobacteria bacterium]